MDMESSLRPFQKISIERKKMQLTEHGFETYEVDRLMFMIGCDTTEVTPVGIENLQLIVAALQAHDLW